MNRSIRLFSLVLLALAGIAGTASAQATLRAGGRLGINLADAALNPDFDTFHPGATHSFRPGIIAGGAVEYSASDLIHFEFDMLYTQKGVRVNYENFRGFGPAVGTFAYDYIEFPVVMKVKFGDDKLRGYLLAGPNIGVNINATGTFRYSNTEASQHDSTYNFTDDVEKIDVAIDMGGGVEYEFGGGIIGFTDLRYSLGIFDVTTPVATRDGSETWYSRDIKLMAGVMFPLWTAGASRR